MLTPRLVHPPLSDHFLRTTTSSDRTGYTTMVPASKLYLTENFFSFTAQNETFAKDKFVCTEYFFPHLFDCRLYQSDSLYVHSSFPISLISTFRLLINQFANVTKSWVLGNHKEISPTQANSDFLLAFFVSIF